MPIYLLSNTPHKEAISLPVFQTNFLHVNIDISSFDALVFTSKNAVYALDALDKNWRNIPSFCIGKATSATIKKLAGDLAYRAQSSYGDAFALEIAPMLQGKKVAFVRAKKIVSNIEEILIKEGVILSSFVAYETTCKRVETIDTFAPESIFIFTSPSCVDCFFHNYAWQPSYQAVFIGEVSANAFPVKTTLHVSAVQTIDACVALAKTLIKQS